MNESDRPGVVSYPLRRRDEALQAGRIVGTLAKDALVGVAGLVVAAGTVAVREFGREIEYTYPGLLKGVDEKGRVLGRFIRGVGEGLRVKSRQARGSQGTGNPTGFRY